MICTRCGTVQRRETAKFCHLCGAPIEPAATNVQPDSTGIPAIESAPQPAQLFKPIALLPGEPDSGNAAQREPEPSTLPGETADEQMRRERYADENTLKTPAVALPGEAVPTIDQPLPQAAPYLKWEEPFAPGRDQPMGRYQQSQTARASHPQPSIWPQERPLAEEHLEDTPDAWKASLAASEASTLRERSHQWSTEYAYAEIRPNHPRDHLPSTPQGRRTTPARTLPEVQDEAPMASLERPIRSTARGPVPGAFSQPKRVKRRRLPLGIAITVGLLLVFVLAGFGLYTVLGAGPQEPSALTPYTDPGHHFSIQYPTVWTIKKPTNHASGVRFTDATDTAELWVTYTPTPPNLTKDQENQFENQFADQEAASAGIATPAPGTDTFAGATWIMRTGIVTLTSGISQQILLYITVHNNLCFEVREVAPLNNYNGPNQTVFMPMLQTLILM